MHKKVSEALKILTDIGMPKAQQNVRSALCLLALSDIKPDGEWARAGDPLMGITPIMQSHCQALSEAVRSEYARNR